MLRLDYSSPWWRPIPQGVQQTAVHESVADYGWLYASDVIDAQAQVAAAIRYARPADVNAVYGRVQPVPYYGAPYGNQPPK